MNTKRTTPVTLIVSFSMVFTMVCLFGTSAATSNGRGLKEQPAVRVLQSDKEDLDFLDSSAKPSFEHRVRSKEHILSGQTENYRGGWSLYGGERKDLSDAGEVGADQPSYTLFCLEQVVFDDGTAWDNPDYGDWLKTYAGKEISVDELENYYPHEYQLEAKLDCFPW
ncbi:MAG: hypothetical protein K2P27_10595 [Lachnospiraceae bacterium]|nr:hypothetical protein [Lachnospiraceae bacterium]